MSFTDATLTARSTTARAIHVTELRTAVNAVRARAGLAAGSFTDSPLAATGIKGVHVSELRTALDEAHNALACLRCRTPTRSRPRVTPVKAIHVKELRNGVQ